MRRDFGRGLLVFLSGALLWPVAALATPPKTPITLELEIPDAPKPFQQGKVIIRVSSVADAPGTEVELLLPDGVVAGETSWIVDLKAGDSPVVLSTVWTITGAVGNVEISARAAARIGPGTTWGDMKTVPLHIGAVESRLEWRMDFVPVAQLIQPGDTQPLSFESTPFPRGAEGGLPDQLPTVMPERASSKKVFAKAADATVTLTGRFQYTDRSGTTLDIDQQVVEVRRGDGAALSPRVYCYTAWDGTFSCSFNHPGTTLRLWVRSWTSFTPGSTRLGVFQGIEIPGGCGSDSIDCSYPVQTSEISCASGTTCNTGTWLISSFSGEPWLGAHQMEQDLIRSWKRIFFDFVHPAGSSNPGPTRITYPVPAGHGTHAHVNGRDPWISIEPPNQKSGDIVVHEYGHAVMSNLWAGYSPRWPASDCPRDHFIQRVSGAGCALSEGFADFWAWYSNQFYDGDSSASNDGPIFNWPGGISTNMETRDGGTYDAGDRVEGNVAAALGDFYDTANDGPGAGPADRLSDGIQHIWHTLYSQSDSNFAQWWSAYWATFSHDACPARDILHFNTINYTNPSCGDPPVTCQAFASCDNAGGGSAFCSGSNNSCFAIDNCYASCDGQYYFCPSPPGICPL